MQLWSIKMRGDIIGYWSFTALAAISLHLIMQLIKNSLKKKEPIKQTPEG